MTYFDSAEDIAITKAEAIHELRLHGDDSAETVDRFIAEMGDLPKYDAQAVLEWLGY